jgi:hypothetical protein
MNDMKILRQRLARVISVLQSWSLQSASRFAVVTMFTLPIISVPTSAFGNPSMSNIETAAPLHTREVLDEWDPADQESCFALGELDIAFHTAHDGPPEVGIVLMDPRGRRFGFDPLTKRGWAELPQAEGSIDCDDSNGKHACGGFVQVCGAVSGTYRIEIIAQDSSSYSVALAARSKEVRDGQRFRFSRSKNVLNNIAIRKGTRDVILVEYSRDPALGVKTQMEDLSRRQAEIPPKAHGE